jgi:hypothetical protein
MRERLKSLREWRCSERLHRRIPLQIMELPKCFNPLAPIVVAETALGSEGLGLTDQTGRNSAQREKGRQERWWAGSAARQRRNRPPLEL